MKKMLCLLACLTLVSTAAFAELKYNGTKGFDSSAFPPDMKEKYKLMEAKCSNPACHTMERTVQAIKDGVAPISKTPFNKDAAKAYGVKMMLRPDSGIDKKEAKTIVELLYFLIDQKSK